MLLKCPGEHCRASDKEIKWNVMRSLRISWSLLLRLSSTCWQHSHTVWTLVLSIYSHGMKMNPFANLCSLQVRWILWPIATTFVMAFQHISFLYELINVASSKFTSSYSIWYQLITFPMLQCVTHICLLPCQYQYSRIDSSSGMVEWGQITILLLALAQYGPVYFCYLSGWELKWITASFSTYKPDIIKVTLPCFQNSK